MDNPNETQETISIKQDDEFVYLVLPQGMYIKMNADMAESVARALLSRVAALRGTFGTAVFDLGNEED